MTRPRTKSRLTEHEVDLILEVVDWAWRRGMTVAEAAAQRLAENEVELRGYRRELRTGPQGSTAKMLQGVYARLEADSRRTRRLMRMFASWRAADSAEHLGAETQRHAGVTS